jgi:pimeloyl-ACP methyl ester carboxylesterase
MNNIVLVHGAFVDGGHWERVYQILKRDDYSVSVVQSPTVSLEDDVAVTRRVLATQKGPAILVGHSYGGAVITETGNDPKVTALVTSPPSHRTGANPWPGSLNTRRPTRRYHRCCHRKTASCSSTKLSLAPLTRLTWTQKKPRSGPTPKCHGV